MELKTTTGLATTIPGCTFNRTAYGIEKEELSRRHNRRGAFNRTAYGIENEEANRGQGKTHTFNRTAYGIEKEKVIRVQA